MRLIEGIQDTLDRMDKRCGIIIGEGPSVTDTRMLEIPDAD